MSPVPGQAVRDAVVAVDALPLALLLQGALPGSVVVAVVDGPPAQGRGRPRLRGPAKAPPGPVVGLHGRRVRRAPPVGREVGEPGPVAAPLGRRREVPVQPREPRAPQGLVVDGSEVPVALVVAPRRVARVDGLVGVAGRARVARQRVPPRGADAGRRAAEALERPARGAPVVVAPRLLPHVHACDGPREGPSAVHVVGVPDGAEGTRKTHVVHADGVGPGHAQEQRVLRSPRGEGVLDFGRARGWGLGLGGVLFVFLTAEERGRSSYLT